MARKAKVLKTEVEENLNEDQHDQNVSGIAMKPSNKMEAMRMAINLLGMMPQDMALNAFDAMVKQMNYTGDDAIPDGSAEKNAATIQMKPSFASASMGESIKEAVNEIFGGDKELSEDFRKKAETLFEAALGVRVAMEREEIKAQLTEEAEKEVEETVELLTEQVDQYLTYACEEWIRENQVAIESTLRAELAENVLEGIRNVFDTNYITVPENKIDVSEALAQKVEELEAKLNAAVNENLEMAKSIEDFNKEEIIDSVSEGLVLTQKSKLAQLVEGIEYTDPDSFEQKVKIVKDKYFPKNAPPKSGILQEDVTGGDNEEPIVTDKAMLKYTNALEVISRK